MTEILRPDLCVLGGGGAGLAAARAAAGHGAKVVVVEKRALGGAYLTDIVPLLAFCGVAARAASIAQAARFGLSAGPLQVDFPRLRRHVQDTVKRFARENAAAPLAGMNVEIVRAVGSFSRPSRLEAGGRSIEAKHFILAPGTIPAPSTIPGAELVRPLRADTLFALEKLPDDLVMIGASFQGLALAQAFLRLGTRVTMIEPGALLPEEDSELVAPVLTQLARDGLILYTQTEIANIEPVRAGVRVNLKGAAQPPVEAAYLMMTTKPLPLVEGLGLKNAGVTYANAGILVDGNGRTSNGRIYAAGGAVGGPEATAAALDQAGRLGARLFGAARASAPPVARILSTEPEMAMIGLSEEAARAKHKTIRVLRAPLNENARARLAYGPEGHVKIVTNSDGYILGAGVVGPQARELIAVFGLAMNKHMKVTDLDAIVSTAPNLMEACRAAALASLPQLGKVSRWRSPWQRR